MCLTKTCLYRNTSDSATALEALQRMQADRKNETCKGKAMWSCLFFDNNRCCNPSCITVKAHICSQDFALLARGLKQCYFHKPLLSLLQLCSHFMQMFHVMLRSNRRVMNTVTRCHRAFNMPPTLNIFQTLTDTFLFITLICKYSDSRASRRQLYLLSNHYIYDICPIFYPIYFCCSD